MPSRQQQLLLGLIAAVLIWQGGVWGDSLLLEPLRMLRAEVARKQESVEKKELQALAVDRAQAKVKTWLKQSLPPDPGKKTRPDAVDAHRQYNSWLTELVHAIGFDEVTVTPRSISRKNAYVEVAVQIDGEGRFSQLAEFLDRFYRTDLLQRIGRLQIVSQDVVGDPPVRFTLEANALALAEAPQRRTLFPRGALTEEISATTTQFTIAAPAEFNLKPPFRVRVDRELLDVAAVDGSTWTVNRGLERTTAVEHPAKAPVTLVPRNRANPELSREDFREFVRTNPFVKPTPPVEYELKFGPFAPPVVVRGKRWEFSLAAKDYDPARGEPTYRLTGDVPAGLQLDAATGKLSWSPDAATPAGDYPILAEVRHPSAPDGRQSAELTLVLAEPNTAPKFPQLAAQTIYRGQAWRISVAAQDTDQPPQQVVYKLGAGVPAECQLDAATGELSWTPADTQPVGPVTISVTATDDGAPPKTSTLTITANVAEDTARQTVLIAIISKDDEREVWFYDQTQNRKTIVREGGELRAAEITAEILVIDEKTVTVKYRDAEYRLKLGDNLRSLATAAPITPADSE